MQQRIISRLWDVLSTLHTSRQISSCLELLDATGTRCLFLSCGSPLPASVSLSGRKARTSHAFHMASDEAAGALSAFGTVSLLEAPYCFLPGGLPVQPEAGPAFFLGLSTDHPEQDRDLAGQLASELTRLFDKTL